jgi:hypothetical protein
MHGRVRTENFGRIRSSRIQLTLWIYAEKNTDSGDIQVPSTWILISQKYREGGYNRTTNCCKTQWRKHGSMQAGSPLLALLSPNLSHAVEGVPAQEAVDSEDGGMPFIKVFNKRRSQANSKASSHLVCSHRPICIFTSADGFLGLEIAWRRDRFRRRCADGKPMFQQATDDLSAAFI